MVRNRLLDARFHCSSHISFHQKIPCTATALNNNLTLAIFTCRVKIGKTPAHTNGVSGHILDNHEVIVQSCQNTRAEINKASHQK
jgi:hypothetical protein